MTPRHTILAYCLLGLTACAQPTAPPPSPASALQKPPLELLGEWGTRGDAPGQLQRPVAIASDTVGNVYIADAGNQFIQKFDPTGRPLLSFQDPLLKAPASLAVDSSGAVYVADAARKWVLVFRPSGERYRILRGSPRSRFRSAPVVAVDLLDNLYIQESGRIVKFGPYLRFEKEWDLPARAEKPPQAASIAATRDGRILVAGPEKNLRVFSSEGEPALSGVALQDGGGPADLAQIVAHKDLVIGHFQGSRAVRGWNGDGREVMAESLDKYLPLQSDAPLAIAATPRGELFIVDPARARVLRFRMNF